VKTASCYIRVSSERQIDLSPMSQLNEIRQWAERNDYLILEDYIFIDEGISGRESKNRPAFNSMIKKAKQKPKPFDAVLVWKFSRFARNKAEAVAFKSILRKECNIEVISISENIGEDKGTAIILESIFEAMDEYYSINLSSEVKRSMKLRAERGEPNGKAPFGYKNGVVNGIKTYIINEEQAEIVKWIYRSFLAGVGMRTIALKLNESEVRTINGNVWDSRNVQYLLENPAYKGFIRWSSDGRNANNKRYKGVENLIIVRGTFAPIITEEIFEEAQIKIKNIRSKYQHYQRQEVPEEWMLRGLLRCDSCGATLLRTSKKEYFVQCGNYAKGKCNVSHSLSLKKADKIVIDALKEVMSGVDAEINIAKSESKEEVEIIDKQKILLQWKKRLERCKKAYQSGIDTLEEYKSEKKMIQEKMKEIEKEIEEKESIKNEETSEKIKKKISQVIAILENNAQPAKAKNEALRSIITKIEYQKKEKTFSILFHP